MNRPTIEVFEEENIFVPEQFQISHSPYTPSSSVTLLEHSRMDPKVWRIHEDSVSLGFNVPVVNISEIMLVLDLKTFDRPIIVNFNEYYSGVNYTANINSNEHVQLMLQLPRNLLQSPTIDTWIKRVLVRITYENYALDDFELTHFSVRAITTDVLYPVSIDVQRTNGESLFSDPTMHFLRQEIEIYFNQSSLGNSARFSPYQVNETILLPQGDYEVFFDWEAYELTEQMTITNESVSILWRIKCVRIDIDLAQDIPGLSITIYDGMFDYYSNILLIPSPSFYIPSGHDITISTQQWSRVHSGSMSTSRMLVLRENQNVTVEISSELISFGGMSLTPARAAIYIFAILFVVSLTLIIVKDRESRTRMIPLLVLFIGIILPWMQVSRSAYFPYSTTQGVFHQTWMISPGIHTSLGSQDNHSVVVGPYDPLRSSVVGIGFGGIVYLLYLVLLVAVIHKLYVSSESPTIQNSQFLYLFVLILIIELMSFQTGYQGWIESLSLGPGIVISFLALALWGLLLKKLEKVIQLPLPPRVE
ncbi:MAG: hypothetical protein ACXACG_00445 [Candidatus Thorarchaeota archaeon]